MKMLRHALSVVLAYQHHLKRVPTAVHARYSDVGWRYFRTDLGRAAVNLLYLLMAALTDRGASVQVMEMTENEKALQASAVPIRVGKSGIEFCLITTRKSQRWGFPKGGIQNHGTIPAAALAEAHEEAGLTGWIAGEPLGQYTYKKNGKQWTVTAVLMVVDDCSKDWKESTERRRKWVSLKQARRLLDRPNLVDLLEQAIERLSSVVDVESKGLAGRLRVLAQKG